MPLIPKIVLKVNHLEYTAIFIFQYVYPTKILIFFTLKKQEQFLELRPFKTSIVCEGVRNY